MIQSFEGLICKNRRISLKQIVALLKLCPNFQSVLYWSYPLSSHGLQIVDNIIQENTK